MSCSGALATSPDELCSDSQTEQGMNGTNSSQPVSPFVMVTNAFHLALTLILIGGNAAILSNLSTKQRLKQSTYYFLCNICIADLVVAVALGQRSLIQLIQVKAKIWCDVTNVMFVLGTGTSVCNLLFYNANNVKALNNIQQIGASMSLIVSRRLSFGSWLFWLFMGAASVASQLPERGCLLGRQTHHTEFIWFLIAQATIAVSVLASLYAGLLYLLRTGIFRKQSRPSVTNNKIGPINKFSSLRSTLSEATFNLKKPRIKRCSEIQSISRNIPNEATTSQKKQSVGSTQSLVYRMSCFTHPTGLVDSIIERRLLYCRRLYYAVSVIMACYLLLWVPMLFTSVYAMFNPTTKVPPVLLTTCLALNGILNITVYWVRNQKFRTSIFKKSCCKLFQ